MIVVNLQGHLTFPDKQRNYPRVWRNTNSSQTQNHPRLWIATSSVLLDDYAYGYADGNMGDRLISFGGGGISYYGDYNPYSYYNGTRWYFGWQNGRRLSNASGNGYTLSFEYNDEGIRTSKTVNGVKHTYRLNGSQIVSEAWGNNLLIYLYDAEGLPIGMMYRNDNYASDTFDTFWFERNLQGDIVAVYDEDGTKLISYVYDAWGYFETEYHNGCTAASVANYNPFLYRGYYYDFELEMYYLQSRYYDPVVGRFISMDKYVSTGQGVLGSNMFAYCYNNPVNMIDVLGTTPVFTREQIEAFGEWVETILGTLIYMSKLSKKGSLLEYWLESNGKIRWSRHHTDHGYPKKHPLVPHDHEWKDDGNGNNHEDPNGLPPNPGFQAPNSKKSIDDNVTKTVAATVGTAAVVYIAYLGVKWVIAAVAAPATCGGSLIVAGVTP